MHFTFDLSATALTFATLLFAMRVLNYAISTVRLVFIGRGLKLLASVLAFVEAFIFAVVMGQIVNDLENITNLLSYCLGASVGSYVGMWMEARFIVSYSTVTVITHEKGKEIAEALRNANYGATLSKGEGRDGEVDIIRSSTVNRDIPHLVRIVHELHPTAFVDVEAVKTVQRGWLPGGPAHRA
jgi:uncharacterized protein YebE (UPF0316 family)